MNLCACGCGTPVRTIWVKGHHWKARRADDLPNEKPCVVCGITLVRHANYRQTDTMWQKQTMHKACRATFNQERFTGRIVKENVRPESGRARARKLYPTLGMCEFCGLVPAKDRHHKDENTSNNERSNIDFVCRSCHLRLEYQIGRTRRGK